VNTAQFRGEECPTSSAAAAYRWLVAGTRPANERRKVMRTPPDGTMRILVIDEQPIVRDALVQIARQLDAGAVCLEAGDVSDGAALLAAHADVALVILDVGAQAAAAPVLLRRLREAGRGCAILVTAPFDDAALARVVLEEGARGFVSKRAAAPLFREVLRLVLAGGVYVPPMAVGVAAPERPAPQPAAPAMTLRRVDPAVHLTARQQAVLALMLKGRPNKLICRTLNLREGTVKTHIANIFRALNVNNRTAAAYAVMRLGLELPDVADEAPRLNGKRRVPLSLVA
jgi:DNA-binding NarL/FixJ family response regulator